MQNSSTARRVEIREQLARENPSVITHQSDLAESHFNLGLFFASANRRSEAEPEYRAALKIHEALMAENPSMTRFPRLATTSHTMLGILYSEMGRLAESEAEHGQALELSLQVAAANPSVPDYQATVALGRLNLGSRFSATRTRLKRNRNTARQFDLSRIGRQVS